MSLVLPILQSTTKPLHRFSQQHQLENVTYTFQFQWNIRAQAWYVDIMDETGATMIAPGLRLVADFALAAYRAERTPPGILFAVDTSGLGLEATLRDLGSRVHFIYISSAEIAAVVPSFAAAA